MTCAKCGRKFKKSTASQALWTYQRVEISHDVWEYEAVCVTACLKTDAEKLREWVRASER